MDRNKTTLPTSMILILSVLIFAMQGCHLFSSKSTTTAPSGDHITAPLYADSMMKGFDLETSVVFILPDSTAMYIRDSAGHFKRFATLHLNDSLSVKNGYGMPFENAFYSVLWHGQSGYVWGTAICHKTWTDFDGDGRRDQILYGYTDYDTSSFEDAQSAHPMWLRFLSATGQQYELHDSGYSDISISELSDPRQRFDQDPNDRSAIHFSRPTKVYYTDAGYPACGYGQYRLLIVFRDGKPQIIHRHSTFNDSGQGNYYEVNLPTVNNHRTDTILLVQKLSMPYMEADTVTTDSLVISIMDSSIIYPHKDTWKTETFYKAPERK
jgi:hypothetical protein